MKTCNIIYAEKSYKRRNKIEVNAFVSLAHLVTSRQGRKDAPGMFGLYTYHVTHSEFKKIKEAGFTVFEGTFNAFIGKA